MNLHSISLVLGHPLNDLKVVLLNSRAYKQSFHTLSAQHTKKKAEKSRHNGNPEHEKPTNFSLL